MTIRHASSIDDLFTALPDPAEEARERGVEFEEARTVAPDFVARLKAAGVYRVLVAREQGGLGGSLMDWLDMATTLAEADASTGWTSGHGAICSVLVANIAEPDFVEKVFADPMSSIAWSNLPRITAREEPDGLRIDGSWSFVTGCLAATHVGGIVRLPGSEDRKPRVVVALAPAEEAEIDRTWDPVGLGGTGSHDVVFRDVFVPWERIFEWPDSRPRVDLPTAVFVPGTWFISMCAAATHLGLARRALDEVRRELDGKKDRYTQLPILEEQAVLRSLEEAEGLLYAYRAGVRQALETIWESGLAGRPASIDIKMDARLACVTAVQQGEKIVRTAFGLAGAAAIGRAGVLQRLLRDSSCLIHHVSANPKSFDEVGRCRIGAIAPEDAYI